MFWAFLALGGGFCDALYYALVKRSIRDMDRYIFAAGIYAITATVLLSLSVSRGLPAWSDQLPPFILITAAIEISATFLYFEALRHTDLSLAIPILSLTPVFLILTSWFILGEQTSTGGIAGIGLILIGSFILFHPRGKTGGLRGVLCNRGVLAMIGVAFLFSIDANMGKLLIIHSDPFFGTSLFCYVVALVFLAYAGKRGGSFPALAPKDTLLILITAGTLAFSVIAINLALTVQIVPFVISLKRSSILFSVLMGWVVFHESGFLQRFTGALIMTLGILCITLS
ncbi:MAG: DMT family transporter [Methanomicrobiales archaeon]|nr:DMT family transporter [Methanomicrobiales archaeon]